MIVVFVVNNMVNYAIKLYRSLCYVQRLVNIRELVAESNMENSLCLMFEQFYFLLYK